MPEPVTAETEEIGDLPFDPPADEEGDSPDAVEAASDVPDGAAIAKDEKEPEAGAEAAGEAEPSPEEETVIGRVTKHLNDQIKAAQEDGDKNQVATLQRRLGRLEEENQRLQREQIEFQRNLLMGKAGKPEEEEKEAPLTKETLSRLTRGFMDKLNLDEEQAEGLAEFLGAYGETLVGTATERAIKPLKEKQDEVEKSARVYQKTQQAAEVITTVARRMKEIGGTAGELADEFMSSQARGDAASSKLYLYLAQSKRDEDGIPADMLDTRAGLNAGLALAGLYGAAEGRLSGASGNGGAKKTAPILGGRPSSRAKEVEQKPTRQQGVEAQIAAEMDELFNVDSRLVDALRDI